MAVIYIISDNRLETYFEDTLDYLYEKYHPQTCENTNYDLSTASERSAFQAEAFFAGDLPDHVPRNKTTRRDRIS